MRGREVLNGGEPAGNSLGRTAPCRQRNGIFGSLGKREKEWSGCALAIGDMTRDIVTLFLLAARSHAVPLGQ
jgi:hypothetical protein